MNEIRYTHVRTEGRGAITLAHNLIEVEDGHNLLYGAAFCSPLDNFSRKIGREIAHSRLIEQPKSVPWFNGYNGKLTCYVLKDILDTRDSPDIETFAPNWAIALIIRELRAKDYISAKESWDLYDRFKV